MDSRLLALSAVVAGGLLFFAVALWPSSEGIATQPGEAEERVVRDVTPVGITPGPPADGPLTRIPVVIPDPPPPPPQWRRFFQPVATAAGTLAVGERELAVAGIKATSVDQQCTGAAGDWPCGRSALTAFRQMLRGRAVECYWAGDETGPAPCRVGTTDIALWLVANGWAEPDPDAPEKLRDALHEAQCAGAGLWKDRRPQDCEASTAAR